MVRRPRVEFEGAVYHVYNRVASGEHVFDDPEEAHAFTDLIRDIKQRDGWTIFAWAVLPNHYHLALRTSVAPLSRGMHTLQNRFSRGFNRRRGRTGAVWQSRYHAKIVDEQRYLSQVVLYVHLNPVRAGLVDEPAKFAWCGHREIVRRVRQPLVDVDDALLCFDERLRAARRAYLAGIGAGIDEFKSGRESTVIEGLRSLVWTDRELVGRAGSGSAGGESSAEGRERPRLEAGEFVAQMCGLLGVDLERVAGRTRDPETAQARRVIATLGVERWQQRCIDLARVMHKNPDVVSWWASLGSRRRLEDADFAARIESLDVLLAERTAQDRNVIPSS